MKIKWTNKYNYPEILADALKYDDYDVEPSANIISVTSLIKSPRIRKYELNPNAEVERDVSDNLWLLLGKSVHKILESSGSKYIRELRLDKIFNNMTLTGKFDYYDYKTQTLGDFKITSKYIKDARKDWEKQLNILSYLVEDILDLKVNNLEVTAVARDFMKKDQYSSQFQDSPVTVFGIEKWNKATTEMYIRKRLLLHSNYNDYICNDEDKWSKPVTYAVTKPNSSRAYRVLDSIDEASEVLRKLSDKSYTIEIRPSEDVFCKDYCPVRSICEINKEREKLWN